MQIDAVDHDVSEACHRDSVDQDSLRNPSDIDLLYRVAEILTLWLITRSCAMNTVGRFRTARGLRTAMPDGPTSARRNTRFPVECTRRCRSRALAALYAFGL